MRYGFDFTDAQVCAFRGGKRTMVTWFVGEQGFLLPDDSSFGKYIGIYRQMYSGDGRLVGRDTRAVRSIPGYIPVPARSSRSAYPFDQQTLASALDRNRCVVLATGTNRVDAYAYDVTGRIRQHSPMLSYRRPHVGAYNDNVAATWSGSAGALFAMHFASQTSSSLSAYPLD
jgi:hypothetical protein